MKFKLSYKEKEYIIEDNLSKKPEDDEIPFIWEDGNYACDCNRSQFIQEQCDENFQELSCGHEIKLLGIIK